MSPEGLIDPHAGPSESRVLVLPPTGADGLAIGKLFSANGIDFAVFRNSAQLCATQRVGAGMLIVSEEALLEAPAELLACIAAQPVWSDLPLIVLTRSGRETTLLVDLLPQLGNVSFVERPIRTSTLLSLVRANLRARGRQYQVRDYLAQQERTQRLIQEGERRYRALVENVTDYVIFMTDRDGRISSWNDGAQAILGYSAHEALGLSMDVFAAANDVAAGVVHPELETARQNGRATYSGWKVRKDGRQLFVECVCVSTFDETDQLPRFAHFWRDVTERHRIEIEREQLLDSERAARREAEHASRTKDEFLATLSHELRTPLNAVLGWTHVLRRGSTLSADVANGLAVIERNARSQAQIIADLLDMSSIISGKVRLDTRRLELASVVNATVETVKPGAQAKAIRLHVAIDAPESPVRGDPNRLQQVFWNLLTNAVKFTPQEGRISVTLARVDAHFVVEVTDNGEGIDPAFLPHVFDRFRQADASNARRHGGLGLGLSIVKQLVELHGGTITAQSAGRGLGATFRVALPVLIASDAALTPPESTQRSSRAEDLPATEVLPETDLKGLRVLVVDDEPDARALIQRLLQDCNASVVMAQSGDEALQLLAAERRDLLICDVGMPGENGYALMRRIRTLQHPNATIPAIALTAYARPEDRVEAIHAGFQMHLPKPVEPIELVATVERFARQSTAGAQEGPAVSSAMRGCYPQG